MSLLCPDLYSLLILQHQNGNFIILFRATYIITNEMFARNFHSLSQCLLRIIFNRHIDIMCCNDFFFFFFGRDLHYFCLGSFGALRGTYMTVRARLWPGLWCLEVMCTQHNQGFSFLVVRRGNHSSEQGKPPDAP